MMTNLAFTKMSILPTLPYSRLNFRTVEGRLAPSGGRVLEAEAGLKRKLVGFEMIDRGIPRHDYKIVDSDGAEIGIVTSGTQSPSLQKAIGMGYVTAEHAAIGTEICVEVREKLLKAKVVKLPFYQAQ